MPFKDQEYIWLRGGDLNRFRDIRALPVQGGSWPPPGPMTYIPFDAPWHKVQEYIWFKGGDLNCFEDIKGLAVWGGQDHPQGPWPT